MLKKNQIIKQRRIIVKNKIKKVLSLALCLALATGISPNAFSAETTEKPIKAVTENTQAPPEQPNGETPPDNMQGGAPDNMRGEAPGNMRGEAPDNMQGEIPGNNAEMDGIQFTDVDKDAWYADYVRFVSARGIMNGKDGMFRPDEITTRAEYILAIYNAAGSPEFSAPGSFTDVAADSEYSKAIAWAEANNIAEGTGDGMFTPDGSLTREMAITFLYRALSALNLTADIPTESKISGFSDNAFVSDWALEAMNTLVDMGIIVGTDEGKLNPQGTLVNAEVAAMIYRVLGGDNIQGGNPGNMEQGAQPGDGANQPGSGESSANASAATVLKDGNNIIGGTYTAEGTDESVFEASGDVKASITDATINKTAGTASSADVADFEGVNSAVRVYGNADVTLSGCTIEASAKNATGVFAYQNGKINIFDSTVTVSGGGAGGVQVAGGGTLYGNNLNVTTESKAAIRSDRGGGTIVIDGGSYTAKGNDGCPIIYSTADITVKNAEGTATNSQAIIIEGKNSVTLDNCTISGSDQSTKEGSIPANVLLYQSSSGDAAEGTSVFNMTDSSLTAQTGVMFYCTNTDSVVNISNSELTLSNNGDLLLVSAGRWGKEGKNGGKCTFNAASQILEGNITVDSISSMSFNLTDSAYTGAILNEGTVDVTMDAESTWVLTGDSSISSLSGDTSGIDLNGHTLLVNGKAYIG